MRTSLRVILGTITIFIIAYILRKIDFLEVYQILRSIKIQFFLLAFASYSLGIIIFNLRTMISLREIIHEHDFWFFLKITMAGHFVNVITPGAQVGGEPIRAYFFGEKYNKPKTKVLGAVIADRIFHAIVSLFFIIASLLFILTYIPVSREFKIIFQTALFFILVFLVLIFLLNMKKSNFNLGKFLKKIGILRSLKSKKIRHIGQHFGNFTKSFKKTFLNKKTLFFGILFSFVYWILSYLSSYFLFLSLGIKVSFFLVIIVMSLGSLIGDFSPTPGGIGIVEGFMIFLYSIVGVSLPSAIIVSLFTRLIGYFYYLVIGGASLFHLEKTLG